MGCITIHVGLFVALCLHAVAADLAPEDQPVLTAMTQMGEETESLATFIQSLPIQFSRKERLLWQLGDVGNYQTATCDACLVLVDTVNTFLEENGTYEEVRNETITLCNDILTGAGFNKSHIMCPGIADLYIPHLLSILRQKPMESNEVCPKLNFCEIPNPEVHITLDTSIQRNHHQHFDTVTRGANGDGEVTQTTIKVVQINDLHIDPEYAEGAPTDCGLLICCRWRYSGQGAANRIGEYTCNSSPRLVNMILEDIEKINPDFILYLGDNPTHAVWEETLEGQNNETRRVIDLIAAKISGKKTYPTVGNHEAYPTNLYYTARPEIQNLNNLLVEYWPKISPLSSEQLATVQTAGYYSSLIRPGLRLISYNSNYGYTMNFYVLLIHDPDTPVYAQMKHFMESTLTEAQANGEKVILLGHHPLGRFDSEVNHAQWLTDLVLRFQNTIVLHVHGHTHNDAFKLFVDENDNKAKSVSYISPSVTTFVNHNPAFRVYTLDGSTFQLLDYEQRYVPVQEGNNATIKVSYTAKNEYQLPDMLPQSWQTISQRMESDDGLLLKYRRNMYAKSGKEAPCDNTCKYETVCSTRNTVYRKYTKCVDSYLPTTTPPAVTLP